MSGFEIYRYFTGDIYKVDMTGQISQRSSHYTTLYHEWQITGAVEYSWVFGKYIPIKKYSLKDILEGKVPFFYKNGKQRSYLVDRKHGIDNTWMFPHNVYLKGFSHGS